MYEYQKGIKEESWAKGSGGRAMEDNQKAINILMEKIKDLQTRSNNEEDVVNQIGNLQNQIRTLQADQVKITEAER